jgi:formylglycine-generating enzyme required for sulfatase activity
MPKSTPESFDVFISYSHANANWVFEWLIPRLSNVGLNVATERDFGIGTPELVNVEQIVDASRHVLLVLTPAWVRDSWANFGALLAQHEDPAGQRPRILPVLLAPCELPSRIRILTRADFTGTEDIEMEFARLLRALGRDPTGGVIPDWRDTRALERYAHQVISTHGRLSFLFVKPAGSRGQTPLEAELEAVFVPLQVDDPEADQKKDPHRKRGQPDATAHELARPEPLAINEVLARYPVFLLKGPPGSGKTTLLRHLAVCFTRGEAAERLGWSGPSLLPILVPLRNFGRYLNEHRATCINPAPRALRQFIEDYFAEYELQLPGGFFYDRLREGRCLVLLDGLDEVGDAAQRACVAQMVSAFIRHYAPAGNRFGLASRPRGYDEVAIHLPRPIVCEVQRLTPEGRDQLVTNLLKVLEPEARLRQEETPALLADMRAKAKVDELSLIPLFCTTLVLVYKYRSATLPERRVDVYKELVDLLLGFWDTSRWEREHTADSRELALTDGTGRAFMGEREAIEAKRDALKCLAAWMQSNNATDLPRAQAEEQLAKFFRSQGANPAEERSWARNFLAMAHHRSGLFVESEPEVYAFAHQNFREYLAATDLVEQLDEEMVRSVLAHADDPLWEEVILLAAAHPDLSARRRDPMVLRLSEADHLVLAGRCAVDAGARLPLARRGQIKQTLYTRMTDAAFTPKDRYAAGEVWDELGGLPDDLDAWVLCPKCADPSTGSGRDLLVAKYPVTNVQFERFIKDEGYENPNYWGGEQSIGWQWRVKGERRGSSAGEVQPEYWQHPRFGRHRRGYPVVGVSWYEATAYAAWLAEWWRIANSKLQVWRNGQLETFNLQPGIFVPRLPTDAEWLRLAGGEKEGKKDRYPWDVQRSGLVTNYETHDGKSAILARANTLESGINGTSPVAMYPLGVSKPFGLWDLAGNVWEWIDSWYDGELSGRVARGGTWSYNQKNARPSVRFEKLPDDSSRRFGFRLVSPIDPDY